LIGDHALTSSAAVAMTTAHTAHRAEVAAWRAESIAAAAEVSAAAVDRRSSSRSSSACAAASASSRRSNQAATSERLFVLSVPGSNSASRAPTPFSSTKSSTSASVVALNDPIGLPSMHLKYAEPSAVRPRAADASAGKCAAASDDPVSALPHVGGSTPHSGYPSRGTVCPTSGAVPLPVRLLTPTATGAIGSINRGTEQRGDVLPVAGSLGEDSQCCCARRARVLSRVRAPSIMCCAP
jgi:hypothetical protein